MYYCKDKSKLENFFHEFSCQDMIRFLEENGILIRERNGYLYPYTEQAATIRDVLERNLEKHHVRVLCETEITEACFHQKKQQFLVRYEKKEEGVEFYVSDTGIGISKEQLTHIFERFVKLNSFIHGTGLGLSICKREWIFMAIVWLKASGTI